jgi:hypothetical protein
MQRQIIYPDSDLHKRARLGFKRECAFDEDSGITASPRSTGIQRPLLLIFCNDGFQNQGINMLNYERHLIVVTVICLVIIVVAIVAIVMGVPLPFIGMG